MPDREKVIKELEECLSASCRGFRPRELCPYTDYEWDIMRDALAMLKEQETSDTRENRIFHCAECGYGIDDIFINDEGKYPILPIYCPNCGRSVKW